MRVYQRETPDPASCWFKASVVSDLVRQSLSSLVGLDSGSWDAWPKFFPTAITPACAPTSADSSVSLSVTSSMRLTSCMIVAQATRRPDHT
eukprot:3752639-Rhodomonas_salina.1